MADDLVRGRGLVWGQHRGDAVSSGNTTAKIVVQLFHSRNAAANCLGVRVEQARRSEVEPGDSTDTFAT